MTGNWQDDSFTGHGRRRAQPGAKEEAGGGRPGGGGSRPETQPGM